MPPTKDKDTCFVCKICGGCYKHWECKKPLCKGDFDKDCRGNSRK